MKKYLKPDAYIDFLEKEDVITTSPGDFDDAISNPPDDGSGIEELEEF